MPLVNPLLAATTAGTLILPVQSSSTAAATAVGVLEDKASYLRALEAKRDRMASLEVECAHTANLEPNGLLLLLKP